MVSVAIDGRVDVEVEANSFDEAKQNVWLYVSDVDLNTMDVVGMSPVNAEDENSEFIDF